MKSHPKLLYVTSRPLRHQQSALEAAPPDVRAVVLDAADRAGILANLEDADFLISERALIIDAQMIAAGPKLRLIQRIGRLTHDIDLAEAGRRNLPVSYAPVLRCAKVAEHAMMQILMLQRNYRLLEHTVRTISDQKPRRCDANTFAYNWANIESVGSLIGATVGIVGFGEIAAELALRLRPFGCRVLYNKRTPLPARSESLFGIEYSSLDDIRSQSDIIVILLPHSQNTEGSVDGAFLRGLKPGAKLVATGASTVLNENAAAEAYLEGRIAGVATDGWNYEPIEPGNNLVALADDPAANVAFTPHVAAGSGTIDWPERRAEYENVVRLLNGLPLINVVSDL